MKIEQYLQGKGHCEMIVTGISVTPQFFKE